MDHSEALKHLRTLINVAFESDDVDEIYLALREMRSIVKNAFPPAVLPKKGPPAEPVHKRAAPKAVKQAK
jgi:hypothetical protein